MISLKAKVIWPFFLPLFALFVWFLPDATWQTVLITQIALIPSTLFVFWPENREKKEVFLLAATALIALAFASYLTYSWYSDEITQCGSGGCAIAEASPYATLFGPLPTAVLGVIGYITILFSLFFKSPLPTALLGAFALAVSVYLTYASLFILQTTCQWCLGSATAATVIALVSYTRFVRSFLL